MKQKIITTDETACIMEKSLYCLVRLNSLQAYSNNALGKHRMGRKSLQNTGDDLSEEKKSLRCYILKAFVFPGNFKTSCEKYIFS